MERMILWILVLITQVMNSGYSQPVDWTYPIEGRTLLSGTFGELRGNHYHGGLDIKPNEDGDQTIIAAADGYIREILVRGGSYGNALILQHKDGYQSLYGHLDRFRRDIDSLVYSRQYDESKFEVSIFPDSTDFPVKKGDPIAIMGNTGYSFGRHVHFEIRHESGTRYNPLLLLPKLTDNRPPQFRNLRINYYDMHGHEYQDKTLAVSRIAAGRYSAGDLTLNALKYSIGVDVVDLHEATHNRNGVYKLQMYRNEELIYETTLDSLDIEDRKYYNEHVDYKSSDLSRVKYHNLKYRTNPIHLDFEEQKKSGPPLLQAFPFRKDQFKIIAVDYQGNASELTFSVKQVEELSIDYAQMYNFILEPDQINRIVLDRYTILFPKNAFLRSHRAYIFEEETVSDNTSLYLIHLGENEVPLYEPALLQIRSDLKEKDKWTLANCQSSGYRAIPTLRKKDHFSANVYQLATYCLIQDTIPPNITFQPINRNRWHFTVKDDIHSFSALKISARVDEDWVLIQSDDKNSRLVFTDFDRAGPGQHTFTLTVEDGCGNITRFSQEFSR